MRLGFQHLSAQHSAGWLAIMALALTTNLFASPAWADDAGKIFKAMSDYVE